MFPLIFFLDIDGVLNHLLWAKRFGTFERLDPECVNVLRIATEHHGARIVISSSWRFNPNWKNIIRKALAEARWDNPPIIDRTPLSSNDSRGKEIGDWLKQNPTQRFIILDDDNDMLPEQLPFFIRTSMREGGLTPRHAKQISEILSR